MWKQRNLLRTVVILTALALPELFTACCERMEREPHHPPDSSANAQFSAPADGPVDSFLERSENRRRQRRRALEPLRPEPQYRILP